MPFFVRDENEIISRGIQELANNSNITQLTPGGKMRFFLETTFKEQGAQYRDFDNNILQSFIRYSRGKFLDFWGDTLARPRRESSFAESSTEDQNFMFYVNSGSFGDINSNADFTIPAGTVVSTVPFEGDVATPGLVPQTEISYTTVSDVICVANRSFAYGHVRANIEGEESIVPRSVLNKHDFTGYAQTSRNLLKCTNRFAISNAENREEDNAYRYRLLNAFKAKSQALKIAIRLAALAVPGVADIKEINYEQGPATYSLYVQSTTPTTSQGLLNRVTDAVTAVSADGIRPFVLAPQYIGMEFVVALIWAGSTTDAQKSTAYANIRDNIEATLNGYDIGESLFLSDLVRIALSSSQQILGIGKTKSGSFEQVYINRSSADTNGVTRSLVIGTSIEPLYNERIILETSGRHRGIEFLT